MVRTNHFAVLKKIKEELSKLDKYSYEFPQVFSKEENAIISHDISSLEQIGVQKLELQSNIQNSIKLLTGLCLELFGQEKYAPKSFSEMKERLASYSSKVENQDQHLSQYSSKLVMKLDQLIESYRDLKPQIEKNRFIITRLLHNHQESYRFWSELKKENSSNYTSKGARVSQSTISQVFAKA